MEEAKSMVNMSVAAMFTAWILGASLILVGLGYTMWSYFSRQDAANQKMKDYVNYIAYDDTTIRGQEVISLFQYAEQEGLFIAIYTSTHDHANGNTHINNVNVDAHPGDYYFIPATCPWSSLHSNADSIPTEHSNAMVVHLLESTRDVIKAQANPNFSKATFWNTYTFNGKLSYDKLVKLFTNNDAACQVFGYPRHYAYDPVIKKYAAYKSHLVYDSETSTDVVGFILYRQAWNTTEF